MSSKFQNDAIFWVEVDKINPNPYQPRRDFNEDRLRDLAESIRQYGILQPLTVTRNEQVKDDGGLKVEYELIAGERRHRAAQMANLSQVPVIIRSGEEDNQAKLELAIIENLQREDLNPIERAEAFDQLSDEFDFTHKEIASQIGKSREYVSNSMRLLKLPEKIKQAIINGNMTEGHARPIMMLRDKPEEQETLFKEVIHKGLTVREAESIARRDAQDKVRKKKNKIDPETKALEDKLSDTFGTRVKIEERDVGGKLVIDFFSEDDLENIIKLVQGEEDVDMGDMMEEYVSSVAQEMSEGSEADSDQVDEADGASQAPEENDGGKSMAETLGSMIAAARKQSEGQDTDDQPDTGFESPEETDNESLTNEDGEEKPVSQEAPSISGDNTSVEDIQADQESDASPETSVGSVSEVSPVNSHEKTESDNRPEKSSEHDESEATAPDPDMPDNRSNIQPERQEEIDEKEMDSSSEEIAGMDDMDISVPTGGDAPVANNQEDAGSGDDAEDEASEAGGEDEMYSVSNFSI